MHYKGHIITKKLPTNEELSKILEKYKENEDTKKLEWDWWQIGGRYCGNIKINFNPNENEENYYLFRQRNNKHFISQILNEAKENNIYYEELDYLRYMGLRENILYVDGGYFKDMINFEIDNCFVVIDDNDNLYVREYWDGKNWVEHKDFEETIKKIDLTDKFITIIDFHD